MVSSGLRVLAPTFGWQQQVQISPGLLAAYSLALTVVSGLAIGLLQRGDGHDQTPAVRCRLGR